MVPAARLRGGAVGEADSPGAGAHPVRAAEVAGVLEGGVAAEVLLQPVPAGIAGASRDQTEGVHVTAAEGHHALDHGLLLGEVPEERADQLLALDVVLGAGEVVLEAHRLAEVMAERGEHEDLAAQALGGLLGPGGAAADQLGHRVDNQQGVRPHIALGVVLGVLRAPDQCVELGEADEPAGAAEHLETDAGLLGFHEELAELLGDPLIGQRVPRLVVDGHLPHEDHRVGVDVRRLAGRELHGPEGPDGVLHEELGRGRPEHSGLEVGHAAVGVHDLPAPDVIQERIDREVPPARGLLRRHVGVEHDLEVLVPDAHAVVRARHRHVDLDPAGGLLAELQDAEGLADGLRTPAPLPEDLLDELERGAEDLEIIVLRLAPLERVDDRSAHQHDLRVRPHLEVQDDLADPLGQLDAPPEVRGQAEAVSRSELGHGRRPELRDAVGGERPLEAEVLHQVVHADLEVLDPGRGLLIGELAVAQEDAPRVTEQLDPPLVVLTEAAARGGDVAVVAELERRLELVRRDEPDLAALLLADVHHSPLGEGSLVAEHVAGRENHQSLHRCLLYEST